MNPADLSPDIRDRLNRYARSIQETNQKFNLTGFQDHETIYTRLILACLEPILDLRVPRGTRFLDMGSGAGIPGIPLCCAIDSFSGLLVESNHKKAGFIADMIGSLPLKNCMVRSERLEEIAIDRTLRESFPFVFSRAFQAPYITIELGAPFLSPGGILFIYTHFDDAIPEGLLDHARKVGLDLVPANRHNEYGFTEQNTLFRKVSPTPSGYPRRFAIIKRAAGAFAG